LLLSELKENQSANIVDKHSIVSVDQVGCATGSQVSIVVFGSYHPPFSFFCVFADREI